MIAKGHNIKDKRALHSTQLYSDKIYSKLMSNSFLFNRQSITTIIMLHLDRQRL